VSVFVAVLHCVDFDSFIDNCRASLSAYYRLISTVYLFLIIECSGLFMFDVILSILFELLCVLMFLSCDCLQW
jgi:hypothetical protein